MCEKLPSMHLIEVFYPQVCDTHIMHVSWQVYFSMEGFCFVPSQPPGNSSLACVHTFLPKVWLLRPPSPQEFPMTFRGLLAPTFRQPKNGNDLCTYRKPLMETLAMQAMLSATPPPPPPAFASCNAYSLTILVSQGRTADGFVTLHTFETLLVPFFSSTKDLLGKIHCLPTTSTLAVCLAQFERCFSIFYVCHALCCN